MNNEYKYCTLCRFFVGLRGENPPEPPKCKLTGKPAEYYAVCDKFMKKATGIKPETRALLNNLLSAVYQTGLEAKTQSAEIAVKNIMRESSAYEQLVESIAELEADISDVNNLLLDYAMSIYPHGDAPEWPTISQGVKDLVDYAKALDKPAKSGAACSVKADELIVDLMYKSWEVGAYGGSAPDEIEQEMELARDEAKAKLVEYIGGLESKVGKWIDNSKYPLNELNGVGNE